MQFSTAFIIAAAATLSSALPTQEVGSSIAARGAEAGNAFDGVAWSATLEVTGGCIEVPRGADKLTIYPGYMCRAYSLPGCNDASVMNNGGHYVGDVAYPALPFRVLSITCWS